MSNSLRPPRYGEQIPLLCLKCNKMFIGPNPHGLRIEKIFKNQKKTQCPECGSKKVVPNPYLHW